MSTNEDDLDQDPAAQAEAKAQAAKRDLELGDLRYVLGSKQGRRVVWRLLSEFGVFRTPHVIGALSEDNAFRAGFQSAGLKLLVEVNQAAPEQYLKMQQEEVDNATRNSSD